MWLPVHVQTVGLTVAERTPILLLRETAGERCLALGIGEAEAAAITLARTHGRPERPLTHDLLADVIDAMGQGLEQVRVTEVRGGTYFAELVFSSGTVVSARPSDSVALAVRTGSPIVADDELLNSHGIPAEDITDTTDESEDVDEEVTRFRDFLNQVSPDDFDESSS